MGITVDKESEHISDKSYYYPLGLGFLALAKLKYHLSGYTRKTPTAIESSIDHDIHIAEKLLGGMKRYGVSVVGKDVLELGPGSDLGMGAYLLSKGARSYTALDVNDNAARAPDVFYARMRQRGINFDQRALQLKVCKDFSLIKSLPTSSIDLVVSSSAFEHFDSPDRVIRELSWVLRPGGAIISSVDLQTHSRWIRDRDPNNIYRYPGWLYRLFYFPGQCNRIRSREYLRYLHGAGFSRIEFQPGDKSLRPNHARVHKAFKNCDDLNVLAFTICAMH